jgi:hypothetical protein
VNEYVLPRNAIQVFPHTYRMNCETSLGASGRCLNQSTWFIGRPDAPLATQRGMCDKCLHSVIESILLNPVLVERHMDRIKELAGVPELMARIEELESAAVGVKTYSTPQDVLASNTKTYPCPYGCNIEPFPSPQALGAHCRKEHPKTEVRGV